MGLDEIALDGVTFNEVCNNGLREAWGEWE